MVRTADWLVSRGGDKRQFVVHYCDDPPERAAAIEYFKSFNCGLYANCPVTDAMWALPVDEANELFAANPVQETYSSLYLRSGDITDDELAPLVHIPELVHFGISSNCITDAGVVYISVLHNLERLRVHSPLLTNACLDTIAEMKSLRSLSLQARSSITVAAFESLVSRLPNVVESWGPLP